MNIELEGLFEKGRRSVAASESLLKRGDYDFSASRAYYAMFYLAEAALLTRNVQFKSHSAVISAFGKEFGRTGELPLVLHHLLRDGFVARQVGDYGPRLSCTEMQANRILQNARDFVAALEPYLLAHGMPIQLGVMISGGGRSLINLIERIAAGTLNGRIAVVIASLSKIKGVQIARDAGLPIEIIRKQDHADIESFSAAIVNALESHSVQLCVQAGWTCLWRMPATWFGRVMNIHPALLPRHGGKGYFGHHVHEAVLAAGDTESGCTVHFANNEYDAGPVILQYKVPVLPGDTPDTLAARVFEQECIAYPEAIRLFAEGKLNIVANRE